MKPSKKTRLSELMDKIEKAQQLELAAKILRENLEWEYFANDVWLTPNPWVTISNHVGSYEIRIKAKPILKRVPLGPEDIPPGSVVRDASMANSGLWASVLRVYKLDIAICSDVKTDTICFWELCEHGWEIKRPGQDWMPCCKEVSE